ncbi:MAG: copper amine oxidase N-terminal domain-containing protein, partial [Rickettsia endosymbiont of Ixodes persulcatus]|nr:copper amine oxidase N-terminal domain-containing protein [Rickettsia endosymbiont of Ixodes persulcatus]
IQGNSISFPSARDIMVFVNQSNVKFAQAPFIIQGTTMVQFRPLFEKLGLTISWDAKSQVITGTKEGLKILLHIGDKHAYVNGEMKELSLAPQIISGNTFIPLRFVAETTHYNVVWNEKEKVVLIDNNQPRRELPENGNWEYSDLNSSVLSMQASDNGVVYFTDRDCTIVVP